MTAPRAASQPGRARTPLRAANAHRVRKTRIPFLAPATANPRRGTESAPYLTLRTLATLLVALLLAPFAAAHPNHTSHADVDYHADAQRLEISLRVIAEDLLAALQAEAGAGAAELSWEKTPADELDRRVRNYVLPRFRFLTRDGREIALGWVGRDGDRADGEQRVWLYFEAPLPDGLEGVRVEHSVLHDRVPRQRNTVRVRHGDRSTTLAFAPGQSPRPIVLAR